MKLSVLLAGVSSLAGLQSGILNLQSNALVMAIRPPRFKRGGMGRQKQGAGTREEKGREGYGRREKREGGKLDSKRGGKRSKFRNIT